MIVAKNLRTTTFSRTACFYARCVELQECVRTAHEAHHSGNRELAEAMIDIIFASFDESHEKLYLAHA